MRIGNVGQIGHIFIYLGFGTFFSERACSSLPRFSSWFTRVCSSCRAAFFTLIRRKTARMENTTIPRITTKMIMVRRIGRYQTPLSIMLTLYFIPFLSVLAKPLALMLNLLCGAHLKINSFAASINFSSVKTEKLYYFIWLGVTCALVAIGYLIHAEKKYAAVSIFLSACVLGAGWSVSVLTDTHPTEIYIRQSFRGLTAGVGKDSSLSLLCCGGNGYYNDQILDDLYAYNSVIDNTVELR